MHPRAKLLVLSTAVLGLAGMVRGGVRHTNVSDARPPHHGPRTALRRSGA